MTIPGNTTSTAGGTRPKNPPWLDIVPVAGALLAVIGVIIGIARAVEKIEIDCPNGSFGDSACHSYPHAAEGTGLAILSALLGLVIAIATFVATELLEAKPTFAATANALTTAVQAQYGDPASAPEPGEASDAPAE